MHVQGSPAQLLRSLRASAAPFGLALVLAVAAALPVLAQGPRRGPGGPPLREFSGNGGPAASSFDGPWEPVRRGYVFVDGAYLPPPYTLELNDTGLLINGHALTCQPPTRGFFGRGMGPLRGGFGDRGGYGGAERDRGGFERDREPDRENPWRRSAGDLYQQLVGGCALFSFPAQPLHKLEASDTYDLLKALTSQEGRALRRLALAERLPPGFDPQLWDEWIENFKPPEDLQDRAVSMIVTYESSERKAQAEIAAARIVRQLEYPLTVGAMVITVLAIGHLLGGRPHAGKPTTGVDESPEMIRTLNWSLLFAVALSGLDLLWTLMAASAGQLREINPIGSHLIENPRHLAGFKIGLTVFAIGLLWLLRRHKRAQLAAWWVCLLLTLVTIRWLAFSSLFFPDA